MMERRGKRPPRAGGRAPGKFRSDRAQPASPRPPPSDPRICRQCGEKVLDIRYHLEHAHPRRPGGARAASLDPGAESALQEVASLLEEARELVFKEPVKAIALVERAREWVLWTRDRTRPRPGPRGGVRAAGPAGKRLDMRAARRPSAPPAPPATPKPDDDLA